MVLVRLFVVLLLVRLNPTMIVLVHPNLFVLLALPW